MLYQWCGAGVCLNNDPFFSREYDFSFVQKSNFFRSVSPRSLLSALCFTTLAHSFGLQITWNFGAGSELLMRHASILIAKNRRSSPVFSLSHSMALLCSSLISLKIQITMLASF